MESTLSSKNLHKLLLVNPSEALKKAEIAYENAIKSNNQQEKLESSLLQLAAHRMLGNYKTGLEKVNDFLPLHETANNQEGIIECFYSKSVFYFGLTELEKSKEYACKVVSFYRKNNNHLKLANSLNTLGCILVKLEEYEKAFSTFYECLQIVENDNDTALLSKVHTNLGKLNYQLREFDASIKHLHIAEQKSELIDDVQLKALALTNMGLALTRIEKYDEALSYLRKAEDCVKEAGFWSIALAIYAEIAKIYIITGNMDKAYEYSNKGISIGQQYSLENVNYMYCLNCYLKFLNHKKQHDKVIKLAKKNLKITAQLSLQELEVEILEELMIAYEAKKEESSALKIAKKLISLERTILKKSEQHKIFKSKARYEMKQNELKIAYQEKIIGLMKSNNEKIEAKNEKYEEEIAHRIDIEERLINLNNELGVFASVASHDMREPLRMIASYAQLVKRRANKIDGSNNELIDFIIDASKRMQALLADLISYTRAGTAEIAMEAIDLNVILELVKSNLRLNIHENNASIKSENLPTVKGTKSLLLLVFQNIISNSIKYRKPDTDPIIDVFKITKNTHHEIHIKDNGIGIEKVYFNDIFEPFRRLHSKKEYDGSGIGLATVKRIVEERLKGKIYVESELEQGATFIIRLPKTLV